MGPGIPPVRETATQIGQSHGICVERIKHFAVIQRLNVNLMKEYSWLTKCTHNNPLDAKSKGSLAVWHTSAQHSVGQTCRHTESPIYQSSSTLNVTLRQ